MPQTASRRIAFLIVALIPLAAPPARAQTPADHDPLHLLNGSVAALVQRVSHSVVQILVTSYGPVQRTDRADTDLVIGRQRSMGSGVVVDAGGYIMTNAHVVANARRVEVVLPGQGEDGGAAAHLASQGRRVEASIVGIAKELDLALLKIDDAVSPPALPLADYDAVRQGQLVFAFGSPEGLRNSVTMGVVSAVARQPDVDNPLVYVQTDAPINHGNSGGPLVDIDGRIVGINTFILSDTDGTQGPGFAIPSALVGMAYQKLRRYGHLHRGEVGILLQTITPTLAGGLSLPQDWGAMISDVQPDSPAARAGLRLEDIVVAVDGEPIASVPRLAFLLFTRSAGDVVRFKVRRADGDFTTDVTVVERAHDFDRLTDRIDPRRSLVPQLGILGVDLTAETAGMTTALRTPSGVIVVGRTPDTSDSADTGLAAGDTIYAINGTPVASVAELRAAAGALAPHRPVVLQIERNGQIVFLAFELD
ncbi:MAG TPA: trypsin-like peptidase domain-containing protein [Vicinamibacterales bacterium]|nr:trypsin-like peptidase domain-containing protein [Vicinamibacterales bacterium]